MEKAKTQIYVGDHLTGDEARFLRELYHDLAGIDAFILANFFVPQQIDFVVITRRSAVILELKCLNGPIFGGENGPWFLENAAGQRVPYKGGNPFKQTLDQKLFLSDAMAKFHFKTAGVPGPTHGKFFQDLLAFVCVYPTLDPASSVSVTDFKVGVAGYDTIRPRLRSLQSDCQWDLETWDAFARDMRLIPVSLKGACDEATQRADDELARYRERMRATIGKSLAPIADGGNEVSGEPLLTRLRERNNVLIIGPTGSTKSFHLDHFAVRLTDSHDELPLLLRAGHYNGASFATYLARELAPYTADKPTKLIDAARRSGRRPMLIVDALNECPADLLSDLLQSIQAFVLLHETRVVLSAQSDVMLPSELESERIVVPPPTAALKRAIYSFHAGIELVEAAGALCGGFTNAYDLVVAGRCHQKASPVTAAPQLYDRFTREYLSLHSITGMAFLRTIADEMMHTLSYSMPRERFEVLVEAFSREHEVALPVMDSIVQSGLLLMRSETVSFEHERLLAYFQALNLQRRTLDSSALPVELNRPRYRALREFIVPRLTVYQDVEDILSITQDVDFLASVIAGNCGDLPRKVLMDECIRALDFAADDLTALAATCETADVGDGRRRLVTVALQRAVEVSGRHATLFSAIGCSLDDTELLERVVALIQATENTLRRIVHGAAQQSRFKPATVWAFAIHHMFVLQGMVPTVPIASILRAFKEWASYGRLDKRDHPGRAAIRGLATLPTPFDIAVLSLFDLRTRLDEACDVAEDLRLVKYAWDTGVYSLRVAAMQFIEQKAHAVHTRYEDQLADVRELLTSLETENVFESTALVDALSAYDALDGPTFSDAAAEINGILEGASFTGEDAKTLADAFGENPQSMRSNAAYGVISKIFETPFGSSYSEAYRDLDDAQRFSLLSLALDRDDEFGTHVTWMLLELIELGREDALPIFKRFATTLPIRERSFCTQEDVARYLLAMKGCSAWLELPPKVLAGKTAHELGWVLMGEIAFWHYRFGASARERTTRLWQSFPSSSVAAGVLSDAISGCIMIYADDIKINFPALWPDEIRKIAEDCLRGDEPPLTLGPQLRFEPKPFLIELLAKVGNTSSLSALRALVDDPRLGPDALNAITTIQQRTQLT